MYTNSAYLHNSLLDIVDKSRPVIVTSCGTYKLYTQKEFTTYRPKGRKDYQLIYVAAGKAHFEIDGDEEILCPGNMVLYRPGRDKNMCIMEMNIQRCSGFTSQEVQ